MLERFLFKTTQKRKPELTAVEYGAILDEALDKLYVEPSVGQVFRQCLMHGACEGPEYIDDAVVFARLTAERIEESERQRKILESVKPEERLIKLHRSSVGYARANVGYGNVWLKVVSQAIDGHLDKAHKIIVRDVKTYQNVLDRFEEELTAEFAVLADTDPDYLLSLQMQWHVLERFGVDPNQVEIAPF